MTTENNSSRYVGDWAIEHILGSGSFAVVWKATHRTTAQQAAIKEINVNRLNSKLRQSLDSEISILKRISHNNIVQLYQVLEDDDKLFLVMEYCDGGDLAQLLRSSCKLSEDVVCKYMYDLASGLKEMWTHQLVHRDLKPQNLLLSTASSSISPINTTTTTTIEDNNNNNNNNNTTTTTTTTTTSTSLQSSLLSSTLKIADFGFARALSPHLMAETLCGSPLYMAPEILLSQKYDAKADLWSIGAILYEMLVGYPPYQGNTQVALLRAIRNKEVSFPPEILTSISHSCRSLVYSLLKRNPIERISFEEFFSHPFFSMYRKEESLDNSGGNDNGDGGGGGENSSSSSSSSNVLLMEKMTIINTHQQDQQDDQQHSIEEELKRTVNTSTNTNTMNTTANNARSIAAAVASVAVTAAGKFTEQFRPRKYYNTHNTTNDNNNNNSSSNSSSSSNTISQQDNEDGFVLIHSPSHKQQLQQTRDVIATTTMNNDNSNNSSGSEKNKGVVNDSNITSDTKNIPFLDSHHNDNIDNDEYNGASVPWQHASRRKFLNKIADILHELAIINDTHYNNNSSIDDEQQEVSVLMNKAISLSSKLSFLLLSLQLYDYILLDQSTTTTTTTTTNDNNNNNNNNNNHTTTTTQQPLHHSLLTNSIDSTDTTTDIDTIKQHASTVLYSAEQITTTLKHTLSHLPPEHTSSLELPNPFNECQSIAVSMANEAAAEELLGNYEKSERLYSMAASLFHFLEVEAKVLPSHPPAVLSVEEERMLRKRASATAERWAICVSKLKE